MTSVPNFKLCLFLNTDDEYVAWTGLVVMSSKIYPLPKFATCVMLTLGASDARSWPSAVSGGPPSLRLVLLNFRGRYATFKSWSQVPWRATRVHWKLKVLSVESHRPERPRVAN